MLARLFATLWLIGISVSTARAQSETVSWSRLLGQPATEFMRTVSPTVQCNDAAFVAYDVPVIDDKTTVPSYWTYDRPLSGTSFRESVKAHSRSVMRMVCKLDD